MIDTKSMAIWWGRLDASGLDTHVVYDPSLPGVPTGQMYLYNAAKDAIIPYDGRIVRQFLRDIEPTELPGVKKMLGRQWRTARKLYVKATACRPQLLEDNA